jgi:CRISPR-associated endonuclease/helicase Cas3
MSEIPTYFRYWGKADPNYEGEPKWHPLVYHCLDVAAVAAVWWITSPIVRRSFLAAFMCPETESDCLQACISHGDAVNLLS